MAPRGRLSAWRKRSNTWAGNWALCRLGVAAAVSDLDYRSALDHRP
jgi:hypothetical protein